MVTQAPKLPVAIDAMGGDKAPDINVEGAISAARLDGLTSILVGDEDKLYRIICAQNAQKLLDDGLLTLVHTSEAIAMDDKPALALRKKKNSSIHIACQLVREEKAVGVLSAGNSGAIMAIALIVLGRLEHILRPAIAAVIPSKSGQTVILDVGANTECQPNNLLQFALMGHAYAETVLSIKKPRLGILANGEEDSKGTELTRATLELLRKTSLNTVGHCEGRDLFSGHVDVVVCDGFSGNLVLKTAEGTASFLMQSIKKSFQEANLVGKIGGQLSKPLFEKIKAKLDPREFGAAPLLGLLAPVYIAHGSSDAYAIRRAISRVVKQSDRDLAAEITKLISKFQHFTT